MTQQRDTVVDTWRKSSECVNGECVEIAHGPGTVLLRRTGVPGVLEFTTSEWDVFVRALRRGEFDELGEPRAGVAAR